jgi:hypothetical protein
MRILLQQKDGGLYFKDADNWTDKPDEAVDFLSSTAAIEFCRTHKISKVQLVLKFPEQSHDIVLPVAKNGVGGHSDGHAPRSAA